MEGKIMINHLGFKARNKELVRENNGNRVSYAKVMSQIGIQKRVEAEVSVFGFVVHVHIFETMHLTRGVEIEFLDFRLLSIEGLKIWYPAGILGVIGWMQKNMGPRFFKMKEDQPLPPAT
ncbi:MAG: hypothetical protein WKG06_07045 [Segetibacter sp.]